MNAIGFVFGLLLIFICTFSLSLRKNVLAEPVDRTFFAHRRASQKMVNACETSRYEKLKETPPPPKTSPSPPHTPQKKKKKNPRACTRLNLWPLVEEGKGCHPILYQTAARLLRVFYGTPLALEPKREYALLDALIVAAQTELKKEQKTTQLSLEQLSLPQNKKNPIQSTYYLMLRGTKRTPREKSYPSLLDLFMIEKERSRLCLTHAPLPLLEALFGAQIANKIFDTLGAEKSSFNKNFFKELCSQEQASMLNEEFLSLFRFTPHRSAQTQKVIVQDEPEIQLKRRIFVHTK